jgi:hypothetical protein
MSKTIARVATTGLAGFGMLAMSSAAHAQSCILCYTSAAAAGPGAIHALDMGILTLLIPALVLFIAICGLIAYRIRVASTPESSRSTAPVGRPHFGISFLRRVLRQRRSASATA